MNIQQLEYIVAVHETGSFARAAEKCYITQPTLSMMVKKLEEELQVVLFDRSVIPVRATEIGQQIIDRAVKIVFSVKSLKEFAAEISESLTGLIRVGILPTIAPYLIPVIMENIRLQLPGLAVHLFELTTEEIIARLQKNKLDVGIAATPLRVSGITEIPLYREEFLVFAPGSEAILKKRTVRLENLSADDVLLLEEGHCMRQQVIQLCAQKPAAEAVYQTGSIQTLIAICEAEKKMTIIPELALGRMNEIQKQAVRPFSGKKPVRQISLLYSDYYARVRLAGKIAGIITKFVSPLLKKSQETELLKIE
ncbi:MAG: LysR substrate-binding domain-containing protein [Ignavibacteria bacterium]|nr:LysR substrate-binding domain-containing protein [Ignavibacteria bacterium]